MRGSHSAGKPVYKKQLTWQGREPSVDSRGVGCLSSEAGRSGRLGSSWISTRLLAVCGGTAAWAKALKVWKDTLRLYPETEEGAWVCLTRICPNASFSDPDGRLMFSREEEVESCRL
jgi:hypothetical protein